MNRRGFKLEELHNGTPNDKSQNERSQKSHEDSFHRPF